MRDHHAADALNAAIFGLLECSIEVDRHPGISLKKRPPNCYEMHYWEDPGAAEIFRLDLDMVGQEVNDARIAGNEALRGNRREDRVDFAGEQHVVERPIGDDNALDRGRELDLEILVSA